MMGRLLRPDNLRINSPIINIQGNNEINRLPNTIEYLNK